MKRYLFSLISLLFLLTFLIGCSRTVTVKVARGDEVRFTITFATAPDWNTYSYYILFYNDNDQSIDISSHYFFHPGYSNYDINIVQNQTGGLSYYYENFFSSWTDFIRLDEFSPILYKGPFSSTTSSQQHLDYSNNATFKASEYSFQTGTLTFSFPLSFLNQSNSQLYFLVLAVKKAEEIGNIQDSLNVVKFIDKTKGRVLEESDQDIIKTPPNESNILSWKVEIL